MKDPEQGLEVKIQLWAGNQTLGESKVSPESPLYLQDPRHRMIEAKTDQRFQIEVIIKKDFDFKGARYVQALVELDGGVRTLSSYIFIGRGFGKTAQRSRHLHTLLTSNSGTWKNYGFAFAELKADGTIDFTPEEAAKEALKRGTIAVTIQRGNATRFEFDPDREPILAPMPSLKTSEKVIKDHCKTHCITYAKGGCCRTPPSEQWRFAPTAGDVGKPLVYTFTYVSRAILLANKRPKTPDAELPAAEKPQENLPEVREPQQTKILTETRREFDLVDLTNDDEVIRPAKIETLEVPIETSYAFSEPAPPKQAMGASKPKPEALEKPKTQPPITNHFKPGTTNIAKSSSSAKRSAASADNKARKKMKIMRQLEHLKLQHEINKLEQEAQDLEEE